MRRMIIFFVISAILSITAKSAYGVILADFGSSEAGNLYGLKNWNTVLKSPHADYTPDGPEGLVALSSLGEYNDYFGIQGVYRDFVSGDRIVVTWYNNSSHEIRFIPRISFNDPDYPASGIYGTWFTMRNFYNYREAMISVPAYSEAKSVFNIAESGVNSCSGSHNMVNVNLHIEWGEHEQKQYLICDRIELLYDADITPPDPVSDLSAQVLSGSRISLSWDIPWDDSGIYEYFIYNGDEIEGHSLINSFTASLLEPLADYEFSVVAVDEAGNWSLLSSPVFARTNALAVSDSLPSGTDFEYLGAFKLPEDIFAYGGEGFAYYPEGDGGQSGSGSLDGYPGSLFISDLNQQEYGYIGEISIPVPVISPNRDASDLNTANLIQSPVNIRPPEIDNWEYVDVWRIGLEIVSPRASLSEFRLYNSWGFHYQLDMSGKTPSVSWCSPGDLSSQVHPYAHCAGPCNQGPYDPQLNNYLFSIDHDYASLHYDSKSLFIGRYRDGGLSGMGPALYAFAPWDYGENPPDNTGFDYITLLEYGSVYNAGQYEFPDSVVYYNHADDWPGGVWLEAGDKSAVAMIGKNAVGDCWYGYTGESMPLTWIEWNIPFPEFPDTDPNGKGWRSNIFIPMIMLYDPLQLARVVQGEIEPHEPQPYTALRLDREMFYNENCSILSSACDSSNNLLYVAEGDAYGWGQLIVHVWKLSDTSQPPADDAVLSLENPAFPGIYLWSYSQKQGNCLEDKGSLWDKIHNTAASKLLAGDITGNGVPDIVAVLQGYGLYFYDLNGRAWTRISPVNITDIGDFALAKTSASQAERIIASFTGHGLYINDDLQGSWSSIVSSDAGIVHAVNLDRDIMGIDEIAVSFNGLQGLYIYDFSDSSFSRILNISPDQLLSGDITGDGFSELVMSFAGYGVYLASYTPGRSQGDKYACFDIIKDIVDNSVWVYKQSLEKGLAISRITWGSPDSGHSIQIADMVSGPGKEVFLPYSQRTYYYNHETLSWSLFAFAPFSRTAGGRFTGGEKEDLLLNHHPSGNIYLFITGENRFEVLAFEGHAGSISRID